MAFKSLNISVVGAKYRISSPIFSDRPIFEPEAGIPPKNYMPKSKGFSFNMDPPYVDFKVIKAMCAVGMREQAEKVLREKRRSYITPDYIFENLKNYTKQSVPKLSDPIYEQVLREAEQQFSCQLNVMDMDKAKDRIPQSTSPGLPYLHQMPGAKKGEVLQQFYPSIKARWEYIGRGGRYPALPDCAAFARSHIGNPDTNKVRPVWAYPLDVIVAEAMFSLPLIDSLTSQDTGRNTAYGMEMMRGGMHWLSSQMRRARLIDPGCKFLMTDYKSFDSSVPAWLIRDCFRIIWGCYAKQPGTTREHYYMFKAIVHYFIETVIRNPDGRRMRKFHGIPSGSMFTNVIGTMVNFIVTRYVVKTMMLWDPMFDIYFGDDGIVCVRGCTLINLDDLRDAISYYFGMELNTAKSYWTNNIDNVHFLGYYHLHGSAFKPASELFASLLYPQYWIDDWKYTLARTMGCLMAAGGNNADIFIVCQMLYIMAVNADTTFDDAHYLISENPRMRRHIMQMGISPSELRSDMFYTRDYSMPRDDCRKIELGVILI